MVKSIVEYTRLVALMYFGTALMAALSSSEDKAEVDFSAGVALISLFLIAVLTLVIAALDMLDLKQRATASKT